MTFYFGNKTGFYPTSRRAETVPNRKTGANALSVFCENPKVTGSHADLVTHPERQIPEAFQADFDIQRTAAIIA
jgi:hypothetical protein